MYVRAAQKGAPPPAGKGVDANWPFADAYFLTEKNVTATGDVTEVPRALQLPAGEYTITVAMRERQGRDTKGAAEDGDGDAGPVGAGFEHGADDEQRHHGHGPQPGS